MVEGERLAVHAQGEEGVPAVHDVLDRRADGHAVDRAGHQLVGRTALGGGPHTALGEQFGEPYADPAGVAHVRPADLVRDAGQGDVALDRLTPQQIVVGEGERAAYALAVDAQPPLRRIHLGHHQRGVHAVEGVVRCGEGADTGDS